MGEGTGKTQHAGHNPSHNARTTHGPQQGPQGALLHHFNETRLGVLIGVSLGGLVLLLVAVVLLIRSYRRRRHGKGFGFEELPGINVSKSAPTTRQSTPHMEKRASVQSTGSTLIESRKFVRSMTLTDRCDYTSLCDYVQPTSPTGVTCTTPVHYQPMMATHIVKKNSFDDENSDQETGSQICFSATYDVVLEQLTVNLLKIKSLKPREPNNTPRDPFVKIYLLPDEKVSQESKTCKKTNSPKFNETFLFHVGAAELATRTLRLSVYDVDKRRVRHSLGHVMVPLADLDLSTTDPLWKDLVMAPQGSSLGDINFSLTYNSNTEKLRIVFLKTRKLRRPSVTDSDDEDMYELLGKIRVEFYHGSSLHKTKYTDTVVWATEMEFNETISFTVPSKQMENISLDVALVAVSDQLLESNHRVYGKVVVGSFLYARGEQLRHWQEMVAKPRTSVTRWHALQSPTKNNNIPK